MHGLGITPREPVRRPLPPPPPAPLENSGNPGVLCAPQVEAPVRALHSAGADDTAVGPLVERTTPIALPPRPPVPESGAHRSLDFPRKAAHNGQAEERPEAPVRRKHHHEDWMKRAPVISPGPFRDRRGS
jgi:hypothetical protein